LLNTFHTVGAQFEQTRANIGRREASIKTALQRILATSAADMLDKSPLPATDPLCTLLAESSKHIQVIVQDWAQRVQDYERGTAFHARYGDSLLVFVYGKVKAGKSSLGNYVAYGNSDPDDVCVGCATPKPQFFLEADTGASEAMTAQRMQARQRFGIGVTETTSSIQGFTLPGVTWVDSPGIHSMTPVNGALASKYASSADVVVFLSHSSSPGRRSDLEEIAGLLHKDKPLVVLLTASDFVDEDEDDNGQLVQALVMKSTQDRDDQVNYVQQELGVLAPALRERLLDTCVYPISVAYAQAGTDAARWKDSGMAALAARIAHIAQDQGLALKRATPLRNLKSFCDTLNTSSTQLEAQLQTQGQYLQGARTEMRHFGERSLTAMRLELTQTAEKLADKHAMDDVAFRTACQQALERTLRDHGYALFQHLGQSLDKAAASACRDVPLDSDLPGFQKHTMTQRYQSKRREGQGKAIGGGLLSLTFGAAGAVLGPWGAAGGVALGSYLGSKLGSAMGRRYDSHETFEINLGDNRQEICLAVRQAMVQIAEKKMTELCGQLDALCFGATQSWLAQCMADLHTLRQEAQLQSRELALELQTH